jgi:hypothetical protein
MELILLKPLKIFQNYQPAAYFFIKVETSFFAERIAKIAKPKLSIHKATMGKSTTTPLG